MSPTNYKPRDYSPRINATYATLLQSRKTFVTVIIIRVSEYAIVCRVKKITSQACVVKTTINYCCSILTLLFSKHEDGMRESNEN